MSDSFSIIIIHHTIFIFTYEVFKCLNAYHKLLINWLFWFLSSFHSLWRNTQRNAIPFSIFHRGYFHFCCLFVRNFKQFNFHQINEFYGFPGPYFDPRNGDTLKRCVSLNNFFSFHFSILFTCHINIIYRQLNREFL